MTDWRAETKRFYGWWLVGALFVIMFFTGGAGFYVFPVFIESFQSEFGWSVEQISWSAGIFAIVFGACGPFVGTLISKIGARKTMLIAAVGASLLNLGWASLQNLPMLYAISVVGGVVMAGTTLVPCQTLVTSWFDEYRGRAMAYSMLGIGFGGMVLPPLNEFMIRAIGWRMSWVVGAGMVWVFVIPLITIFVRTKPQDLGLLPDGEAASETAEGQEKQRLVGLSVADAVRTVAFPLLGEHLYPSADWPVDHQLPLRAVRHSTGRVHCAPGGNVLRRRGRVFGCREVPLRMGGRSMEPDDIDGRDRISGGGRPGGARAVRRPRRRHQPARSVAARRSLRHRFWWSGHSAAGAGVVMSGFAVGVLVGIPLAGRIFDKTGSYEIAIIIAVAVFAVSGVLSLMVRPDKYVSRFTAG